MSALRAYSMPLGDVIQRRIDNRYNQKRIEKHHEGHRAPLACSPLMPWLLHQERLYREQVAKSQPKHPYSQPIYHVYHLRHGELPHNFLGNLAWRAVSFIGSFFDAWSAIHA